MEVGNGKKLIKETKEEKSGTKEGTMLLDMFFHQVWATVIKCMAHKNCDLHYQKVLVLPPLCFFRDVTHA